MTTLYSQRIQQKLTSALNPTYLIIEDQSAQHAGHAGSHPAGETHFAITIASAQFLGKSKVAQHRIVYEILAEELNEHVHALSLNCTNP